MKNGLRQCHFQIVYSERRICLPSRSASAWVFPIASFSVCDVSRCPVIEEYASRKRRVKKKLRRKTLRALFRGFTRGWRADFASACLMIIFLTDTQVLFHILTRKRAGNIKTDMLNVSGNSA